MPGTTLKHLSAMEAVMDTIDDEVRTDAHRKVMERLCREYGEALRAYDRAKEAGDPDVTSQLEAVVVEKSNIMQAYMERSLNATDAALH